MVLCSKTQADYLYWHPQHHLNGQDLKNVRLLNFKSEYAPHLFFTFRTRLLLQLLLQFFPREEIQVMAEIVQIYCVSSFKESTHVFELVVGFFLFH